MWIGSWAEIRSRTYIIDCKVSPLPAVSNIAATGLAIAREKVCQRVDFGFAAVWTDQVIHIEQLQRVSAIAAILLFAVLGTKLAEPLRIATAQPLSGPFTLQNEEIVKQFSVALRFQTPFGP